MTQAELKKLAEIAGLEVRAAQPNTWEDQNKMVLVDDVVFSYWQPDVDLNQSLECLEGLGKHYQITSGGGLEAAVYIFSDEFYDDSIAEGINKSTATAICTAILEAANHG